MTTYDHLHERLAYLASYAQESRQLLSQPKSKDVLDGLASVLTDLDETLAKVHTLFTRYCEEP